MMINLGRHVDGSGTHFKPDKVSEFGSRFSAQTEHMIVLIIASVTRWGDFRRRLMKISCVIPYCE